MMGVWKQFGSRGRDDRWHPLATSLRGYVGGVDLGCIYLGFEEASEGYYFLHVNNEVFSAMRLHCSVMPEAA